MTQSLEAQLTALCEQHGLKHLSIHTSGKGEFYVAAHRGETCRHSTLDNTSITHAIQGAIARLAEAVEVPVLVSMGEVA